MFRNKDDGYGKNVLADDDIYNTIYTDKYTQDLIQQYINGIGLLSCLLYMVVYY